MTKLEVIVRVRPKKADSEVGVYVTDNQTVTIKNKKGSQNQWTFSRVYDTDSTQETIFTENVHDLINTAVEGRNVCILSYGPTGTGKTFTMVGSPQFPGIIPRTASLLLETVRKLRSTAEDVALSMSYIEVYNEKICDLLAREQRDIKIVGSKSKSVTLDGMTTLPIQSFEHFREYFIQADKKRSVAATRCNSESSRSHAILTFTISMKIKQDGKVFSKFSKIDLADLAGSEDNRRTNNEGQQFLESTKINLSLGVLKRVIKAVADRRAAIPYRESKLTRILADSLGGNTHSLLFLNVAPEADFLADTELSMTFSQDAKRVINQPFANVEVEVLKEDAEKDAKAGEATPSPSYSSSPLAKTPMREVNNLKRVFLERVNKRRGVLQAAQSPTHSSPQVKSRKLAEELDYSAIPSAPFSESTIMDHFEPSSMEPPSIVQNATVVDGKGDFVREINSATDPTCFSGVGAALAKEILQHRPFTNFAHFSQTVGKASARKIYKKF